MCDLKRSYWSFVNGKTYIGQSPKPQVDSNQPKSPPPLFCLLVRYSAHIMSHDVTLPNHTSCIIEHLIWENWAEKPFETGSIHFMQFPVTLVQLAEKPPPPAAKQVKILRLDLSISCNFQLSWQKRPPSFLPFCERPSSHHTCSIPMVPILQIHTQIPPIWISSLGYQLCQLFKMLTYRDVQDTVSWCRWKAYKQPNHNPQ